MMKKLILVRFSVVSYCLQQHLPLGQENPGHSFGLSDGQVLFLLIHVCSADSIQTPVKKKILKHKNHITVII